MAISYHLENDDAGFEYTSVAKYLNHPDAELYKEVATQNSTLVVFADGKMATIQTSARTEPVVFVDYEDGIIHKIFNYWYKNKDGEWILIR